MQEALPTLLLIGGMFVVMYFLMIRPQQQKAKAHQEMIDGLTRGDHIIMQSGIYGKITKVTDEVFEVEIADGIVIRQLKSMVLGVDAKPEPIKKSAAKKDASKKDLVKKPRAKAAKASEESA